MSVDLTDWVSGLGGSLQDLDERFSALDPNDDEQRIGAYILAVTIIGRALQLLPGFEAELTTLRDLAHKLDEVSVGNNVLAPPYRETTGRAPEGMDRARTKARAVAAVDLMIGNGFKTPEALEFVTQQLRLRRVTGRQGKLVTARTVKEWRDKIHNPTEADNPNARDMYAIAMLGMDERAPLSRDRTKKLAAKLCTP
jgi:hypothetical protein